LVRRMAGEVSSVMQPAPHHAGSATTAPATPDRKLSIQELQLVARAGALSPSMGLERPFEGSPMGLERPFEGSPPARPVAVAELERRRSVPLGAVETDGHAIDGKEGGAESPSVVPSELPSRRGEKRDFTKDFDQGERAPR
jgi:hypothetical protein